MKKLLQTCCLALVGISAPTISVLAATSTASFNVSAIVTADTCTISTTPGPLTFPTDNNVEYQTAKQVATTTIAVTCNPTTVSYTIGLLSANNPNSTTGVGVLKSGTNTIGYGLFQDASHAKPWGTGDNAKNSGGTIYGQTNTQASVAAGTYSDIVNVTVTYT